MKRKYDYHITGERRPNIVPVVAQHCLLLDNKKYVTKKENSPIIFKLYGHYPRKTVKHITRLLKHALSILCKCKKLHSGYKTFAEQLFDFRNGPNIAKTNCTNIS
jgi:hypothetical protein